MSAEPVDHARGEPSLERARRPQRSAAARYLGFVAVAFTAVAFARGAGRAAVFVLAGLAAAALLVRFARALRSPPP